MAGISGLLVDSLHGIRGVVAHRRRRSRTPILRELSSPRRGPFDFLPRPAGRATRGQATWVCIQRSLPRERGVRGRAARAVSRCSARARTARALVERRSSRDGTALRSPTSAVNPARPCIRSGTTGPPWNSSAWSRTRTRIDRPCPFRGAARTRRRVHPAPSPERAPLVFPERERARADIRVRMGART